MKATVTALGLAVLLSGCAAMAVTPIEAMIGASVGLSVYQEVTRKNVNRCVEHGPDYCLAWEWQRRSDDAPLLTAEVE